MPAENGRPGSTASCIPHATSPEVLSRCPVSGSGLSREGGPEAGGFPSKFRLKARRRAADRSRRAWAPPAVGNGSPCPRAVRSTASTPLIHGGASGHTRASRAYPTPHSSGRTNSTRVTASYSAPALRLIPGGCRAPAWRASARAGARAGETGTGGSPSPSRARSGSPAFPSNRGRDSSPAERGETSLRSTDTARVEGSMSMGLSAGCCPPTAGRQPGRGTSSRTAPHFQAMETAGDTAGSASVWAKRSKSRPCRFSCSRTQGWWRTRRKTCRSQQCSPMPGSGWTGPS